MTGVFSDNSPGRTGAAVLLTMLLMALSCTPDDAERKQSPDLDKTVRHLTIGSDTIAVCETGSGPDMIVMHGRNFSKEMMRSVVDHYKGRFHVVSYDALGHGESSRPKAFTLTDQSDVMVAVAERLHLKKPAAIGFSMGSYITLLTAERHPELFSRIVLIGTRGQSETRGTGRIFAPRTTPEQIRTFSRSANPPVPLSVEERERIGRSLVGFDLLRDASKATVPALVLTGQYDGLNTPTEGRRVAEALPKAVFHEIPDAGHIAFFENPDRVFELMDAFLAKHGAENNLPPETTE